ncbi:gliding motility-associated C-terminal domain-containing protein [Algibacter sp. R77976]|uniref:T9SS type B sorting domain-containing protein n=1 Tax=Algibacter sp. R77976 TaxID=3093873 RepID=UPI0037CC3EEF
MKIFTKSLVYHKVLLLAILLASAFTQAQVQQAFAPRFNEAVNGDFTIIANNTISRTATNSYNGGSNNHDGSNNNLVYVDIDGNSGIGANTFNSSSATFDNPSSGASCLTLKSVLLYWTAADREPGPDFASDNQPGWEFDDVLLMLPGETNYTLYEADEVIYRGRDTHFSNEPYICVKDITTEVNNLVDPYQTYQVANVEGKIGSLSDHDGVPIGVSGGWQIVFVYESPDLPLKNISIFDGYAHVDEVDSGDILFNGFQTVPSGDVNARVLIGALEGDQTLGGDALQIENTSGVFVDLTTSPTTPIRAANNFFNSRITIDNANFINRTPASTNTLGFDAAVFDLSNPGNTIIDNNQTSATFNLTSNLEVYGLYLLGLSVEVWEPDLGPINVIVTSPGTVNPGDTLNASFNVENKGNDNAENLRIFEQLPPQLISVLPPAATPTAHTSLPSGVTYQYDTTKNLLEFFVDDSLVTAGSTSFNVNFDLQIRDECYFLETDCTLEFDVQFEATYNGEINTDTQTTLSSATIDPCSVSGIEDPLTIEVNQPSGPTINAPANSSTSACTYTNQTEVDTAYTDWLALFSVNGSCNINGQFDQTNYTAPDICGGSVSVTYEVTNMCTLPTSETRTFEITAPVAITYTAPTNDTSDACDYTDQNTLDTAFNNWVSAQTTAFNIANGCSPVLTDDSATASIPVLCDGGTTTVNWNITDLCETFTETATFTVNAPVAITYTAPANASFDACDYTDQNALDTAFNNWVSAQTTAFNIANGCSPVLTDDSATASIPVLCDGGTTTVTWTITDLCETFTETATFTVNAPVAITYTAPANASFDACDYTDQNALDTAFNNWVSAQTTAFSIANGCSPVLTGDSATASIPVLCDGGTTTVSWTITDLCETFTETATFTVNAPVAITYTAPANDTSDACDYTDQNALDTAFNNWVSAQTTAFSIANGCSPVLTDDSATASIPVLCDGGTTTVSWTITDLCETFTETATFTVNAPVAITYTAPANDTTDACDYTDQNALDTAFNNWVSAQTTAFSIANGCSPVLTDDSAAASIPVLCDGGTTTVSWTITDLCETFTETATFTVNAPVAITYTAPADDSSNAAEFDDPDAAVAQANLDADIAAWLAAQNATINGSVANGCSPVINNDYANQTISFCSSDTITVNWTITDLCETINLSATYTFTQPDGINFTDPSSVSTNACDFDNDDPSIAQANLDADIAAWVTAQNDIITNSLSGGSPSVSNDYTNQSIDLCTGGSITINWTIDDICETINRSATYTVTAPVAITYTAPANASSDACDYTDQNALDTAFNNWVSAQTTAFNIANGCSPVLTDDSATASIPVLCDGGTTTVTWTITDLCETFTETATFTVNAPVAITYTAPSNDTSDACDYTDQNALDTAFNNWVSAQTTAFSIANGCSPVLTDDSAAASIPVLCDGGTTTVSWTITDLCETFTETATFTVNAPVAITYTAPANDTSNACDYTDQNALDTAFNNWVSAQTTAFSIANGCSPVLTDDSATASIPVLCDGGTTTVSWTITDLCETITETATFTVNAPVAITYTAPVNDSSDACDYTDQNALDTAFNNWVSAQTTAFNIANGCSPVLTDDSATASIPVLCDGGTTTVSWTITDLCETITETATFTVNAPVAITYTAPANDTTDACDYTDQNALDTAFNNWVSAQTTAFSIANGCSPVLTDDSAAASIPVLCDGGTTTVSWTITDLCETFTETATFTVNAPVAITYTAPVDDSSNAAEFDDPDAAVAQANLDADIAAWLAAQNTTINGSVANGCAPVINNDYVNQTISFCSSDTITVNWTITDLCETINLSATYTFTQPDGINFTDPSSVSTNACDFDNDDPSIAQANLDADIAAWVTAQNDIITNSLSGGSPSVSNDYTNQSIDLCTGGSITINWTIDDICETINRSATYTVTAPVAITYTAPANASSDACDYTDQNALDTAFNNWVSAQTTAFNIANGCSPVLTDDSATASIPVLCDGGTTTVTWTITDLCETFTETATFTVNAPVAITYTAPSNDTSDACDYTDQNALDTAFNNWVSAQTTAFSIANGCSPVLTDDSAAASIPVLCDGGTTTVSWTITDLCETFTETATFTVNAPVAITYTAPADDSSNACDYTDQNALDTAFNNWVSAQTTAFSIANGCSPVLTDDSATASIPVLCDGGTTTVSWTITDLCETITETATFTVNAPVAITYTAPVNDSSDACDYTDQNALDTAFNNWVSAQTTAFNIANGCSPVLTDDSATASIPVLCDGGTTIVSWTITDLCETFTETATFTVNAPVAITYTAPADDSSNAAEFDDPDAAVAQANLDADIAAWLAAQNATINGSVANGCSPVINNDYVNQTISFCSSDTITVNWTITDLCETINLSATYTFTQPDGINFTDPSSVSTNACDFDNDDPSIAQANLDADIAAWVTAQNDIITNSLSGGSPSVSNDYTNQSIDLCTGGSITINWTIDDICETFTPNATYTVTPPEAITFIAPVDDSSNTCDYTDQNALDTAFNNWVAAQTSAFSIANGCSPVLTDNSTIASIPVLCDGGTTTVTWTITDLCETITETADFIVNKPLEITYTAPIDDNSDACEFGTSDLVSAQNNLNMDISTWVNNETARINDSFNGGCSPTLSNDFVAQTIDFCTGGSITINWSITDLCETKNVSATYTFTQPETPIFNQTTLPSNITVECDAIPDPEALTSSNSCGNIGVVYNETLTDGTCPNEYSIKRTWTATNICGVSVTNTQIITVEDNTAPVLNLPADVSAECSDSLTTTEFGEATATDNCDPSPIVTYNDERIDGVCAGTFTITRTWTATDACGNTISADQIISTTDVTAPEFDQTTLPGDIVVECNSIPEAVTLTATDNCGTAIVTVEDVRIDGNCPSNYEIKRSYTATDECGVTNTHIQTITVQDTTPPVFVETLPNLNIVVECDAIPDAETLTATDICGSAKVTVSDARTDGDCPNSYRLARTWVATDDCGLTTTYTQNIIVQDTTPPAFVEALPTDTTVECDMLPDTTTLTAIDNCGDATVTVSDERTDGNCPSNYTIARTWIATDECGLTTTHTQIITVEDTTAPVPSTSYETILNVSCTDIPEAPEVEFEDNCSSNVIIDLVETNTFDESVIADYQIIRTWTVRDACNNEAAYTQTLNVALDEIVNEVVAEDVCFDNGVINLDNFLPEDAYGGTWEILQGNSIATVTGSIFDPTNLEEAYSEDFNPNTEGIEYVIRYTGFQTGCLNITDVIMVVDASCKVLPCGEKDISISTAITPNGDGRNETFDIEGITLCGFVAEVKIFNRWGALVYETNEYTLGSEREGNAFGVFGKWDGSSTKASFGNNGKLPNGTYYYIINLRNSGLDPITGPIYLGTK